MEYLVTMTTQLDFRYTGLLFDPVTDSSGRRSRWPSPRTARSVCSCGCPGREGRRCLAPSRPSGRM